MCSLRFLPTSVYAIVIVYCIYFGFGLQASADRHRRSSLADQRGAAASAFDSTDRGGFGPTTWAMWMDGPTFDGFWLDTWRGVPKTYAVSIHMCRCKACSVITVYHAAFLPACIKSSKRRPVRQTMKSCLQRLVRHLQSLGIRFVLWTVF